MEFMNKTVQGMELDLMSLIGELLNKIWVIMFSGIIAGSAIFLGSMILMPPTYSSTVSLYANNAINHEDVNNVSYSDLSASIMIANTCSTIIKSDVVLEEVLERSKLTITNEDLSRMLYTAPVTDTEIIEIHIKGRNPKTVAMLANTFADVAKEKLTEIVEGSAVKILNVADIPTKPSGPGYLKIAVFGVFLGCALAVLVILLFAIFDLRIRSEKDLESWDYPIIGVVPDHATVKNKGGYYRASSRSGAK